jgi:hypothetical protein
MLAPVESVAVRVTGDPGVLAVVSTDTKPEPLTVAVIVFAAVAAAGLGIGFWLRGVQPRTTVR